MVSPAPGIADGVNPDSAEPTHTPPPPESPCRRHLWLGALYQLALADGEFNPRERQLLEELLAQELPDESLESLHHPGDGALLHRLGRGTAAAEEFLRSAVVMALADGRLGVPELALLNHWSELLDVGQAVLAKLQADGDGSEPHSTLASLRGWLDGLSPSDPALARLLVKLIPAQCPFERDVVVLGHRLLHIPPMCRINPLYEQLMALRFRCLCSLAGETPPIQAGSGDALP